jgi:hypothetical protein
MMRVNNASTGPTVRNYVRLRRYMFIGLLLLLSGMLFAEQYNYRISWDANPEATRYRVIVAEGNDTGWRVVMNFETEALFADRLFDEGLFRYQVLARDILGIWSEPSQWLSFRVSAPEPPPPEPEIGPESTPPPEQYLPPTLELEPLPEPVAPEPEPEPESTPESTPPPEQYLPSALELEPLPEPVAPEPEPEPESTLSPEQYPPSTLEFEPLPEPVAPEPEPESEPESTPPSAPELEPLPEPAEPEPEPVVPPPEEASLKPKFSLGAGIDINLMDSGTSFALGVSLAVECRFNEIFSVGTYMISNFGLESMLSIESGLFVRWYVLRLSRIPLDLYLEPNYGVLAAMKDNNAQNSRGSMEVGLAVGGRFFFPYFYLEPYIRFGYPFLGGVGLRIGYQTGRGK